MRERVAAYVFSTRERFIRFVIVDSIFTLAVGFAIGYAVRVLV